MAITNKLITFNKLTSFETQLAQGNILETSIVFIKDAKKIWTKGTYFDCSGGSNNIAVYETTDDVYNGVLTSSISLNEIFYDARIYTIVIKQRISIAKYNVFIFNRCSDKSPGTNYFSCLYTNNSEQILYKLSFLNTSNTITLTKQDLALKSDIPNTDDFATQANLTSAVTQLTINIAKKQDKLVSGTNIKTINGESILGSGDIAISGGGSSSGSAAYPEVNHGTSDTIFNLTPNTFHIWDEVESLQLVYRRPTAGIANEYLFQFTSGATATTLMLPDTIKWVGGSAPTIKPNSIYQISILNGLGSVLEFDNAPPVTLITFYWEGSPLQAEEGMTWEQWCNSAYNNTTLMISYGQVKVNGMYPVVYSGGDYVYGTDVIVLNGYYVMGETGGN